MILTRYGRFIWANAVHELRHRYSGSVAGYFWNLFVPLAQIAVFAVVFGIVMRYSIPAPPGRGLSDTSNFLLFLCSGLLAWNAFADTLVRSSSSLVGNAGYLQKLCVPEQVFVAQQACVGFVTGLLSIAVFLSYVLLIMRDGPHIAWLQAVPLLVLFIAFAHGLGMIFACLNVFFRDIQPLLQVVVPLWMWLTPVVYPETLLSGPTVGLAAVFKLNPAYYFVRGFQMSIHDAVLIPLGLWSTCFILAAAVNGVAHVVLARLRHEIRDVL